MKKAMKAVALVIVAALMISVGVWALTSINIQMKSRVYFIAETGVKVAISGEIEGGEMDDDKRSFTAYTYDTGNKNDNFIINSGTAWELDDDITIVRNADGTYTVTYIFTFSNDADQFTLTEEEEDVVIEITPPEFTGSNLALSGGAEYTVTPEEGDPYTAYSNSATIAAGETIRFEYALSVVDLKKSVASTGVEFEVNINFADDGGQG